MTPLYKDEMRLATWGDSSRSGPWVKFFLPDRDALEAFIGKDGKRFASVLIEIGDDEQPVQAAPEPKPAAQKAPKPIAQWLALRCQDGEFQLFASHQGGFPHPNEEGAADWCRSVCGVESRGDIDGNPEAEALFNRKIRGEWSRWCIARGITY